MACLAAFLTLLSGTPHLDCLCPDGHIKLFCLTFASGSSSCCCHGACCQASPGEQKPARCCCHGRHARGHNAPGSQVSSPACRKTLSHSETAILPAGSAERPHDTITPAVLAPVAAVAVPPAGAACCRLSWQSYHQPPPTNLVITLRHLTI